MKHYTQIVIASMLALMLYACSDTKSEDVKPAPATPAETAVAAEVAKDSQTTVQLADVGDLKTQADIDKQEAKLKSERAATIADIQNLNAQIDAAHKLIGLQDTATKLVQARSVEIVNESRAAKVEVFAWSVLVLSVIAGVGYFMFPAFLESIPFVSKVEPYLGKASLVGGGLAAASFFAADYVADWVWVGWLMLLGGIGGLVYHFHTDITNFISAHASLTKVVSDAEALAKKALSGVESEIASLKANHAAQLAKAEATITAVKSSAVDEINKVRNVATQVVTGIDEKGVAFAKVVKKDA
jgi:hypothetical protein